MSWFQKRTIKEIIDQALDDSMKRLLENQHTASHYTALVKSEQENIKRLLKQKEAIAKDGVVSDSKQ